MEASSQAGQIAKLRMRGLCSARASLYEVERILFGTGPQSQVHYWSQFRRLLLHLLQPAYRRCVWNLLPFSQRKVCRSFLAENIHTRHTTLTFYPRYQQLELVHVDDRGCVGAVEFR